jgi:hypothetical protein
MAVPAIDAQHADVVLMTERHLLDANDLLARSIGRARVDQADPQPPRDYQRSAEEAHLGHGAGATRKDLGHAASCWWCVGCWSFAAGNKTAAADSMCLPARASTVPHPSGQSNATRCRSFGAASQERSSPTLLRSVAKWSCSSTACMGTNDATARKALSACFGGARPLTLHGTAGDPPGTRSARILADSTRLSQEPLPVGPTKRGLP